MVHINTHTTTQLIIITQTYNQKTDKEKNQNIQSQSNKIYAT